MSRRNARRRKKLGITLAGGETAPQRPTQGRRTDIDQSPPPILAARAKRCQIDSASVLHETDMGRCILSLSEGDERRQIADAWAGMSTALRNYRTRFLGQTGDPQGAAIAMVPDRMETDQSYRVDLRTADERDRAAKAAWQEWEARMKALPAPQMIWAIRGALYGFMGDAALWRDGCPTAHGVAAVAGLRVLGTSA
jgi:hypothetical protein